MDHSEYLRLHPTYYPLVLKLLPAKVSFSARQNNSAKALDDSSYTPPKPTVKFSDKPQRLAIPPPKIRKVARDRL